MTKVRSGPIFLGVIIFSYPFLIYFGLQYFSPRAIAIFLLLMVSVRFYFARKNQAAVNNIHWILLAAMLATSITLATGSVIGLKYYPVLVNLALLTTFGFSLFRPPTIIERFARLQHPELPPAAVKYTRNVTVVWCLFFTINASIALGTVYASDKIWAIYNGFIAYLLIGSLFGAEYLVRIITQRKLLPTPTATTNK